jgi:hypothetical protein
VYWGKKASHGPALCGQRHDVNEVRLCPSVQACEGGVGGEMWELGSVCASHPPSDAMARHWVTLVEGVSRSCIAVGCHGRGGGGAGRQGVFCKGIEFALHLRCFDGPRPLGGVASSCESISCTPCAVLAQIFPPPLLGFYLSDNALSAFLQTRHSQRRLLQPDVSVDAMSYRPCACVPALSHYFNSRTALVLLPSKDRGARPLA